MSKKTKDAIVKKMISHGFETGFINGYVEPKIKKKRTLKNKLPKK